MRTPEQLDLDRLTRWLVSAGIAVVVAMLCAATVLTLMAGCAVGTELATGEPMFGITTGTANAVAAKTGQAVAGMFGTLLPPPFDVIVGGGLLALLGHSQGRHRGWSEAAGEPAQAKQAAAMDNQTTERLASLTTQVSALSTQVNSGV